VLDVFAVDVRLINCWSRRLCDKVPLKLLVCIFVSNGVLVAEVITTQSSLQETRYDYCSIASRLSVSKRILR